jgi:DNA-binding CsgD family transcriptional regulator
MDAMESLYASYLHARSPLLEDRLKFLLDTISHLLKLEQCSIVFSTDEQPDYHVIRSEFGAGSALQLPVSALTVPQQPGAAGEGVVVFQTMVLAVDGPSQKPARKKPPNQGHDQHVVNAFFPMNDGSSIRFVASRRFDRGEFSPRERTFLTKALEAIKSEINHELASQYRDLLSESTGKLLTDSRCGILLITKHMVVIEKSAVADDLLQEIRVLLFSNNRIYSDFPKYQLALERAIHDLSTDKDLDHTILEPVENQSGDKYTIAIRRNPDKPQTWLRDVSFCLFIIAWAEDISHLAPLLDLWQLSPAEKKALLAIVEFDSIKKAAQILEISTNTVKAHLKSAYRKLGVDNKAMLFKRLNLVRKIKALLS